MVLELGGGRDAPTAMEVAFLAALEDLPLDAWGHEDERGPWLTLTMSFFLADRTCVEAVRLDFYGDAICGGWSPDIFSSDFGLRAADAGVVTEPPEGLPLQHGSPKHLAVNARAWFLGHRESWPTTSRGRAWLKREATRRKG